MGIFNLFQKKKKTQFSHDKAEYQWESALEEYCNIHGIAQEDLDLDNLDTEVEDEIWEYAGNHIAIFITWLAKHDFLQTEFFTPKELDVLKEEKISAVSFLMEYCDGTLARDMLKEEILDFVDEYYEGDNGYYSDYCDFI
ncbi:MAG: hypothetical protein K2K70_10050, partial [Lachnospiraceae bacterium]|nr:hypothetical protein [Lachnospiraceae bacterium]